MKTIRILLVLLIGLALFSCEKKEIEIEDDTHWAYLCVIAKHNHEYLTNVNYIITEYTVDDSIVIDEGYISEKTMFYFKNDTEYKIELTRECYKPSIVKYLNDTYEFRHYIYMQYELDNTSMYYCEPDTIIIRD